MKWDVWNRVLAVCGAAALVIHFWPMAYWSSETLYFLRFAAAFSLQLLFCRMTENRLLRYLPLLLTVALVLWGGWLYRTSPAWTYATLAGYVGGYCSPAIACAAACLFHRVCRMRRG